MTFYRYVRPVKFNEHRLELELQPRGGVCLRFDQVQNSLIFSHARCREDEMFAKDVARRIADQRARTRTDALRRFFTITLPAQRMDKGDWGAEALCTMVRDRCRDIEEQEVDSVLFGYVRRELHELSHALTTIMGQNKRAQATADVWLLGLEAAHFKDTYAAHSHG